MRKLKGVIDRIEGEVAVIRYDKKDILFPVELLEAAEEGEAVVLLVMNTEEDAEKSSEIAQNLLKEILKED